MPMAWFVCQSVAEKQILTPPRRVQDDSPIGASR